MVFRYRIQTHVQYAHLFRRESYVGQVRRSGVELSSLIGAWLFVLVVLLGLQGVKFLVQVVVMVSHFLAKLFFYGELYQVPEVSPIGTL